MEKALITSEMITAGGDDMEEVRQAADLSVMGFRDLGLGFRILGFRV